MVLVREAVAVAEASRRDAAFAKSLFSIAVDVVLTSMTEAVG
jgi:hypothetical protein